MNRRRIVTALLVVAALPLIGVGWQRLATGMDEERFPPPGQLVTVDDEGTRLHLDARGRQHRDADPQAPVVLLDAGTPGFSAQWGWIQPAITEFATVVSYDRPGMGWSDARSEDDGDPRLTAEQLHTALRQIDLPGPYLLVGHSYGGLTSRLFAAAYPDEVSGMVLVDPSHPEQARRLDMGDPAGSMRFMGPLAHIGALRLAVSTGLLDSMIGPLPERQADQAVARFVRPESWSAVQSELAAWNDIAGELRSAAPLGDLPLTVVTAGNGSLDGWQQLHEELAAMSSRGRHTTVAEATHLSLLTDRTHSRATVDAVQATLVEAGAR